MDQTLDFDYTPSGQINTQVNSNPVYDPTLTTYVQDFVINGLNQIMSENRIGYSYDMADNLTQADGKTYGYDYANRLTSLTAATGNASLPLPGPFPPIFGSPNQIFCLRQTVSKVYDAASRLSTVTKGPASSEFIYDGANMIAEYNASINALKTRYVRPKSTSLFCSERDLFFSQNQRSAFIASLFIPKPQHFQPLIIFFERCVPARRNPGKLLMFRTHGQAC